MIFVFKKLVKWQQYFYLYYCSNLTSNNSVRKLTSNAVNSQKKLCPDVMVQKTQHHVHNDFKFRLGCKVQLIVWHFFYLAVVSMKHLVFPQSVTPIPWRFCDVVKCVFSKKATKFGKIFTVDLTLTIYCQIDGEDFLNFCGLLK